MEFTATANIQASPDKIWAILTDAPNYPEWDPHVERIEGTIAQGEQIKAFTKFSPDRAFPAKVTEFVPEKSMTWSGGMPLGLFKGVRTFTLESQADGSIQFTLREVFSGLLLPLIGRTIPDLNPVFHDFAQGLKAHAEKSM